MQRNQISGLPLPVSANKVPNADNHYLGKWPFIAVAEDFEAVTQITGSFSLS